MDSYTYSFKRAGNRPMEAWSLEGTKLIQNGSVAVDLTTVNSGSFSDLPSGQNWASTLVLEHDGGSLKIVCQDSRDGESRSQYMNLVMAVLGDLAVVNPDASFRAGGGRFMTYALFIVGALVSLLGFWLCLSALLSLGTEWASFAMSVGPLTLVFGVFLGWSGSPWSKPTTRSPRELIDWLSTWLSDAGAYA